MSSYTKQFVVLAVSSFLLIGSDGQSNERTAGTAVPTHHTAELRAKKPFAPASNIELNVLPRRDEVQLTIYNAEDLTLVRETRKMTLKRGWNWLQFMWSNTLIDPTSLELTPVSHADQIEITQLVYPPRLNELARWTIFSEVSGEAEFELTYFTSGLKWNANYEAMLSPDETTMQLKSFVRVDNHSGEDYENAQVRLALGAINMIDPIRENAKRELPYGTPKTLLGGDPFGSRLNQYGNYFENPQDKDKVIVSFMETGYCPMAPGYSPIAPKDITKEGLSEYQLYTIEGHETIPDGLGKRLPNVEASSIPVNNIYTCQLFKGGETTEVSRHLSFTNSTDHNLGLFPLPEGRHDIYRTVSDNTSAFVGIEQGRYFPKSAEVELSLGVSENILIQSDLIKEETHNYIFDATGNISGWSEKNTYRIKATNTRSIPVSAELTRVINHEKKDQRAQNLLNSINIKRLDFRDATLREVFDVVSTEIAEHDWIHAKASGILFQSTLSDTGEGAAENITMSIRDMPLYVLLQYLAEMAALKFEVYPSSAMVVGESNWSVEKSGDYGVYEELDINHIKFTLELPATSTKEFTYTVTFEHGTRRDFHGSRFIHHANGENT